MSFTRPTLLPQWATGAGNVLEPSSGKKTDGWQTNERPPARFQNWLHYIAYLWFQWLDQQEQASTAGLAAEITNRTTAVAAEATRVNIQRDFQMSSSPRDKISTTFAPVAVASGGTFAGPQHVIVGAGGNWSVSKDRGRSWTAAASLGSMTWNAVAYDGSVFTAVGTAQSIYISDVTVSSWSAQTAAFTGTINDVIYVNFLSMRILCGTTGGGAGEIETAPLSVWTTRGSPSGTTALYKLATDGTTVVAVGAAGSDGRIIKSTNGTTWTTAATITGAGALKHVVYSSALQKWFVASDTGIWSSPDLTTWTSWGYVLDSSHVFSGLVALDSSVAAFHHHSSLTSIYCMMKFSPDGTNWYANVGFGGNGGNSKPRKFYAYDPNATNGSKTYSIWIANQFDTSFSISQWVAPTAFS